MPTDAADKPYAPSRNQTPCPSNVVDDKQKKYNQVPLHGVKPKGATNDNFTVGRGGRKKK